VSTWMIADRDLDLKISGQFFRPDVGWYLKDAQPWRFLYDYGTIPGLLLSIGSLIVFFAGFFKERYRKWQRYMLLILLTSILGGGIIVNSVLKPYWGRPRPGQIKEFGGLWDYRHPYQPGTPGKGQAFPCGHCTMGFLFTSLFFLRRESRTIAYLGGTFGLLYGSALGAARIVQGGHYPSDVIWSLGIIFSVATILYYFVLRIPSQEAHRDVRLSKTQKRVAVVCLVISVTALSIVFLTRRPFYETYEQNFLPGPQTTEIRVELNAPLEGAEVRYRNRKDGLLLFHVGGFGWIRAGLGFTVDAHQNGNTLILKGDLRTHGYFSELNQRAEVFLPLSFKNRLPVKFVSPDTSD